MTKPLRIYLAAQYGWRNQLKEYAAQLTAAGFVVTSSWLNERASPTADLNDLTPRFLKHHAHIDVRDIQDADCLVLFTVEPTELTKRGGRHVEFGMGYALGKKLIVCGPRENIFHYLDGVKQFDTFQEVLTYLTENYQQ